MADQKDDNKDSKVFVMTRPKEGENLLVIQTKAQADKVDELSEIYDLCFFDYLLNLDGELTDKQHEIIISAFSPALAYQFFMQNSEKSQSLVEELLKPENPSAKEFKKIVESKFDDISQIYVLMKRMLYDFIADIDELGFDDAIMVHHDFFHDLKDSFDSLPECFCEGIIHTVSNLTVAKRTKKTTKKNPKK